jgi:hypothetical protein
MNWRGVPDEGLGKRMKGENEGMNGDKDQGTYDSTI